MAGQSFYFDSPMMIRNGLYFKLCYCVITTLSPWILNSPLWFLAICATSSRRNWLPVVFSPFVWTSPGLLWGLHLFQRLQTKSSSFTSSSSSDAVWWLEWMPSFLQTVGNVQGYTLHAYLITRLLSSVHSIKLSSFIPTSGKEADLNVHELVDDWH